MANATLDFRELDQTIISTNFDVDTYELEPFFYPYHLYVEERISNDVPRDSKTNLYDLFDAGINNLEEEISSHITIGEKISSQTQILLTNNYNTIISNFSSTAGSFDTIHYDSLISELSGLDSLTSFSDMSGSVMQWINDYVNDFSINQNPENSDDSNLILTQALTADIQRITEQILNKVFRNLVQLIRFKRDYRMYGPRSTFYGNCYKNDISCQHYTAVPASCFTQRTNNYMIGKKAYEDEITSVGGEIKNSVWHISPHNSYAIAKHTHNVSIDIGHLPSEVKAEHGIVYKDAGQGDRPYQLRLVSVGASWREMAGGAHLRGICDWKNRDAESGIMILSSANYSYSWKSNSYCKLVSNSKWGSNPWGNDDLKLPTYSTRVWMWMNNDTGTNISNPTEYM